MTNSDLLVVTDLDGSLLDAGTERFDAAREVLAMLAGRNIPVVANTSKTHAEFQPLRQRLPADDPYVVENGAAIYLPAGRRWSRPVDAESLPGQWRIGLGTPIADIRQLLSALRSTYRFEAYGDWDVEQVRRHTSMSESAAALALQREFSEPLLWLDSDSARRSFEREIRAKGLRTLAGGGFLHVLSNTDKRLGLQRVKRYYRDSFAKDPIVVALGDSDNDVPMLQAADFAVLVRSPANKLPVVPGHSRLRVSHHQGAAGWAESVAAILAELGD